MRLRFVPTITLCFNPRTRVGCDRCGKPHLTRRTPCFNPRTRVGCDVHGAGGKVAFLSVSIHAPAWGATPRPLTGFLRHKSFNPRTLVGCDWRPCWAFPSASRFQSTHPRGVRRPPSGKPGTAGLFQSTHPRGVRHAVTSASGLVSAFQSTHPRGVRHQHSQQQAPQQGGFNPRTRVGCD